MLFGRMYPGAAAGLGAIRGLTFCGRNEMVEPCRGIATLPIQSNCPAGAS
jgi:hypothetical protein